MPTNEGRRITRLANVETGQRKRVEISGIEGGQAVNRIDMDDDLTADDLYDTYRRYPTYKDILKLEVDAVWSNYLNENTIPLDRMLELKDCMEDAVNYGWCVVVVDARNGTPRCERWHPMIDGVGCSIIETTKKGFPTRIRIQGRFSESNVGIEYEVPHYPCKTRKIKIGEKGGNPIFSEEPMRDRPKEGEWGFFIIRTRGGKKGLRGLPYYLSLVMPIRKSYDIIENYGIYAENQALAHMIMKLENNSKTRRASVKAQYDRQPTHRKLTIIGAEDEAEWVSPMNSSWDPFPMLQQIDKYIARSTQLNKLMLEGDPAGHLSASETAINNWESKVKEKQAFWLSQFKPILMALGASKEVGFADPSKPAFISLMQGLKAARDAMDGIVKREDIVDLYKEYLQKHGGNNKLRPEEKEMQDPENGKEEDKDGGDDDGDI